MYRSISVGILLVIAAGCAHELTVDDHNGGGGGSSSTSSSSGQGSSSSSSTSTSSSGMASACVPNETKTCYDGPPGTEKIGLCVAGLATCAANGASFGPCVGQVVPAQEICGDSKDQDCDGVPDGSCPCVPGSKESCYSGPAGSQGIGACKAGSKTCLADGSGFGPCVGEVVPVSELCGNLIDEDCDGMVNEADAGCNPNECPGCTVSPAPVCMSTAVVVGHYEGGNKTVCIAAGDGSSFDLALMSYDPTNWTLVGAINRVTKIQVYSYDPGTTIQGNGAIPTSLQTGGNVPANPYNYAMSMGDCPAHTGYTGAVFGVPQAEVCHMESGLAGQCSYPGYACLAISP